MSRQATKHDLQAIARAIDMPFHRAETTVQLANRLVQFCMSKRVEFEKARKELAVVQTLAQQRVYKHAAGKCPQGEHLSSCDDDGYCKLCGEQ